MVYVFSFTVVICYGVRCSVSELFVMVVLWLFVVVLIVLDGLLC